MANAITTSRAVRPGHGSLADQIQLDRDSRVPLHTQLRDELAKVIADGFSNGDQFFAERELVDALMVSRITVRRAMADLAGQGHLVRKVGRGGTTVRIAPADVRFSKGNGQQGQPPAEPPKAIGIFAPDWDSEAANAILGQFAAGCRKSGLEMKLHWFHENEALENVLAQCDERSGETAFLLNLGSDVNGRLYQALHQRGYKTVSTDLMPEGYAGDVVATDARAAIRIGMEHLASLGHQRVVLLVNEPIRDKSVVDKMDEFLLLMSEQKQSLTGRIVVCGTQAWHNSYEAAYGHMAEVWDLWSGQKPTAIFTVSDPGAWAVLKWFRERGIDVPGEVSVLGYENAASSAHVDSGADDPGASDGGGGCAVPGSADLAFFGAKPDSTGSAHSDCAGQHGRRQGIIFVIPFYIRRDRSRPVRIRRKLCTLVTRKAADQRLYTD